ncbi:hypothetical protein SUNI508_01932 [Seiridium unicorne]|uniref:Uncharacterized protein n=1 Tax=Seiridium unicorne TaxID=138068 RepID=A0ABR2UKB7_9PEZI
MCRRILTHRMHHDVRKPMMMPQDIEGSRGVIYANPFQTSHHRCELSIKAHAHTWLLNLPVHGCEYHSCCVPSEEIIHCECAEEKIWEAEHLMWDSDHEEDEDFNPETCYNYTLEHRHVKIESWCLGGLCNGRTCVRAACNVGPEAKWRALEEFDFQEFWDPFYGPDLELDDYGLLFYEMEQLNTIFEDLMIHAAVLHDVSANRSAEGLSLVANAAEIYLRAKEKFDKQLRTVIGFMR